MIKKLREFIITKVYENIKLYGKKKIPIEDAQKKVRKESKHVTIKKSMKHKGSKREKERQNTDKTETK